MKIKNQNKIKLVKQFNQIFASIKNKIPKVKNSKIVKINLLIQLIEKINFIFKIIRYINKKAKPIFKISLIRFNY